MILIDCPCCEAKLITSLPVPATLRCDECAVIVDVTDAAAHEVALAA